MKVNFPNRLMIVLERLEVQPTYGFAPGSLAGDGVMDEDLARRPNKNGGAVVVQKFSSLSLFFDVFEWPYPSQGV